MSHYGEVERLINAIPRLQIRNYPAGTAVPKVKAVKPLLDYNGFSGTARMRTWEVAKWLMAGDRMPKPRRCDLCEKPADQYHAENYFDFASYIPICRSCHGKVHNRLRNFSTFEMRRLDWGKPESHWINLVGPTQLPVATWWSASGGREPSFADFVETST